MAKKTVSYGDAFQTKGVAYIRHHLADRLISDKVLNSREEFNKIVWNNFRNSTSKSLFLFLISMFGVDVIATIVANDTKQALWSAGITPECKTSTLVVLKKELYQKLEKMDTLEVYKLCSIAKIQKTSANDHFLTF